MGTRLTTPNKWTAQHSKILVDTFKGKETEAIAKSLGISTETIYRIRKLPEFETRLKALEAGSIKKTIEKEIERSSNNAAREYLQKHQLYASRKIVRLMRKGDAKNRLQFEAAKDILDRTGLKPIDIIETRERAYTHEEVERAKNTLNEVETIITRLENKDSRFLLARQTKTELPKSGSVTDIGSDAPTKDIQET